MAQTSPAIAEKNRTGMRAGLLVMAASLCFVIACALAPAPRDKALTLIFAPGTTYPVVASRLISLDARIMRIGAKENIVTVRFSDGWHLADLWRIGAYIPLRSGGLGDCLINSAKTRSLSSATRATD